MERRRRRQPSPLRQSLTFWGVVLFVCVVAGLVSFKFGRDWLGKRLADLEMTPGAPRIVAQSNSQSEAAARAEAEAKAPEKPEVALEDREPTAAEKRDREEQRALGEPQDGAQTNQGAAEGTSSSGAGAPTDDDEGRFLVTAGAYPDETNASRIVATLAARGHTPEIEKITRGGREFYRVNVAVMRGRSNAEGLRDELTSAGIPAQVTRAR